MDKKNEDAAPATGTNPLYQGTSRPGSAGDQPEDSINEAEDAVPMKTVRDNNEELPEDLGS